MSDLVCIRPERPEDVAAIRAVNCAAFEREAEADVVDALRNSGKLLISLIAEEKGRIIGHIGFSQVTVYTADGEFTAVGLAPVAVTPKKQGRGIGSRLIVVGLGECLERDHEIVFVLGHPGYYPRFGFVPAASRGLNWEIEVPNDAFMVREHPAGALAGRRGIVKFQKEFTGV